MLALLRTYRFPAAFTALLLLLTSSLPLVQHVCAQAMDAPMPVMEDCCCERDAAHAVAATPDHHATSDLPPAHHGDTSPCADATAPAPAHLTTHADAPCCSVDVQQADLEQVVPAPTLDLLTVPVFFFAGTPLLLPDDTGQPGPPLPRSDHAPPVRTHLLLASFLN